MKKLLSIFLFFAAYTSYAQTDTVVIKYSTPAKIDTSGLASKAKLKADSLTLANAITAAAGGGVVSLNSRTGAIVLDKSDVGLPLTDNTSDVNKPISTLQQNALNLKQDAATALDVMYVNTQ